MQLVLVAGLDGRVGELIGLAADKRHVLPDQGVGGGRVGLGRLHLEHKVVFCLPRGLLRL